ncbi:pentapeptide repeat-containing protein [Aquamicrobium defluvii]|uniref:pentapeptide repeat-containing protein n=1 Tax=Aquamicrobium defluvii TaxID=69279 RepID=UPI0004AEBADB|nr:pentapeptide repeat-containing protein [Aquamicrobium defluvii]
MSKENGGSNPASRTANRGDDDKLRHAPTGPQVARGVLDRSSADAHRRWVLHGRQGPGGLEVVGFDASGARLDGEEIVGARLEATSFKRANVSFTDISHGAIIGCDFTRAFVSSLKLLGATVERCVFDFAIARLIDFKHANVRDNSFEGTRLDNSRWTEADCEQTSFRYANFGNAQFDSSRFSLCDFRQARFRPVTRLPSMTMAGAIFDRCDFRGAYFTGADLSGATFSRCRFQGAHGVPAAAENLIMITPTFIDDELSDTGNESIDNKEELLSRLMKRSEWPVSFEETGDPRYPYEAKDIEGKTWTVRLNAFPDEHCAYTLHIDHEPTENLTEWPAAWKRPPAVKPTSKPNLARADDAHEKATYEREQASFKRSRTIPPSRRFK